MSNETIYDEQIAPKLLEIADLCKANGIPFHAVAYYKRDGEDYQREDAGVTRVNPADSMPAWTLLDAAYRARGNFDDLVNFLKKNVSPENDGSIYLGMFRDGGLFGPGGPLGG